MPRFFTSVVYIRVKCYKELTHPLIENLLNVFMIQAHSGESLKRIRGNLYVLIWKNAWKRHIAEECVYYD